VTTPGVARHRLAARIVSRPVRADPERHELERVLAALLEAPSTVFLPAWSYRRWHLMLQYPDLSSRSHEVTRRLGHERDTALRHPLVQELVAWAGRRRREQPVAGAAAALVVLRRALKNLEQPPDQRAVAEALVVAVDTASPAPIYRERHGEVHLDVELLADASPEGTSGENPRLGAVLRSLLACTGARVDEPLVSRVEDAVVQASDWWMRHTVPTPAELPGPKRQGAELTGLRLPGIAPAHSLPSSERLARVIDDPRMYGLVAGPRPGCRRPCQLAWRRGLTFWVATWLASERDAPVPGAEVTAWWAAQLVHLDRPTADCRGARWRARRRRPQAPGAR
jgi:hypothetical protein